MHDDFHALTIAEVDRETPDAISVALAVPEALRSAFQWKPGQFLAVRAVLDGAEVRRSYSICAGPDEPHLRIAIKRVPGGTFSCWANTALRTGMTLEAMPPAGRFVLPPGDGTPRHVLALAAGSGITPVIAMVSRALLREPETRVTLVYGNRTADGIIFRQRLEDLKDRYIGRFTLLHILSRNEESDAPLLQGRITGEKVTALAGHLFRIEDVGHAFLCGPGSMIRDARNALLALGLPRDRVHHEFFAAGGGAYRNPGQGAARRSEAASPPPVVADHSPDEIGAAENVEILAVLDGVRHRFTARPGEAIVDAALRAGLRAPYACKGGMCCTCRAKLVEGLAPMTINYSLEPWEIERGFVLTCQAVPRTGRVVVDYDQM